jgi:hypothetical protein
MYVCVCVCFIMYVHVCVYVCVYMCMYMKGWKETFRTCSDRPWGQTSPLYNEYRVFPGVKRPWRGVDHPTPSSAVVKKE